MTRNYVSAVKHKKYSHEMLQKAIKLVNDGKSLRSVAKSMEISLSVLHRHVKFGANIKKKGGQPALTGVEEENLVNHLQIWRDWGYPIDLMSLRLLVKDFLDRQGKSVCKFKENLPGRDFVYSFLKRHKGKLSSRKCQNIKSSRAAVSSEAITQYFDKLGKELQNVPSSNIVNYDETNLCVDPGRRFVITRRGCKYPETIMNSSKSSISVMFAAAGNGEILPPYAVYKAQHLNNSWRNGGPLNSRYNRTKSGWFDSSCFSDWIESIVLPYFSKLEGKKILIGYNLSSHLYINVIRICKEHDIHFVFLPANSTHLTQPLDVAFFRPMKMSWRNILEEWKKGPGRGESCVPKDKFPPLLKRLCETLKSENVLAGFKKCGIQPLNRESVLQMLPSAESTVSENGNAETVTAVQSIDQSFKDLLQTQRHGFGPKPKKKRTKVAATPGKSVGVADFENDEEPSLSAGGPSTSNSYKKATTSKKGLFSKQAKKKKSKYLDLSSSDESCSDYSLQDSDSEWIEEENSDLEMEIETSDQENTSIAIGGYLLIKVFGQKKKVFRNYVGKVVEPQDEGYICRFYKRIKQTNHFVPTEEEAFFNKNDVLLKLHQRNASQTSRFNGSVAFINDLSSFYVN